MNKNFENLKNAILPLSHNRHDWVACKTEWFLADIFRTRDPETCPCGHTPICELCLLRNKITDREIIVGNVCVKHFMGLPSDKLFAACHRVWKTMEKSLTQPAAYFFHERQIINHWEYEFVVDTAKKRNLTDRQMSTRKQINAKVLTRWTRRGKADLISNSPTWQTHPCEDCASERQGIEHAEKMAKERQHQLDEISFPIGLIPPNFGNPY